MRPIHLAAIGMLLVASSARAQSPTDIAAVRATIERHYAAIRGGDNETVLAQHMPQFSWFPGAGELLWTFETIEQQLTEVNAALGDATVDTHIRHLDVRLYGNVAVATYYLVGSVSAAGGVVTTGPWRVSEVWVREGNVWREAHHHESPLRGSLAP